MSRLWLLRLAGHPEYDERRHGHPYDRHFGFVVRAHTEAEARALAVEEATPWHDPEIGAEWSDPERSTCVPLESAGPTEVVIEDFHAG